MIDVKNLRDVLATLQAYGVNHFKSSDFEVSLNAQPQPHIPVKEQVSEEKPELTPEIKHVVDEFTSVMKLSDNDLVDRLFPMEEDEEE